MFGARLWAPFFEVKIVKQTYMKSRIKPFLKSSLSIIVNVFPFILTLVLVYVISHREGGFPQEPEDLFSWGENLILLLLLLPVIIGYYLYSKKKYIEKLEDAIRILNTKYKLWEKDDWGWYNKNRFKPESDGEDFGGFDYPPYLGETFSEALSNSRKRLRKLVKGK